MISNCQANDLDDVTFRFWGELTGKLPPKDYQIDMKYVYVDFR